MRRIDRLARDEVKSWAIKANHTLALAFTLLLTPLAVAEAGSISWSETYTATIDQRQLDYSNESYGTFVNEYGWTRPVSLSLWQEFVAETNSDLNAVILFASTSMGESSPSFDLKIYEGRGVGGTLLESTTFSWTTDSREGRWQPFVLDNPVAMQAGGHYTFSVENLSTNDGIKLRSSYFLGIDSGTNPYADGSCMWQGYQMRAVEGDLDGVWGNASDPSGELNQSTCMDLAFQTATSIQVIDPIPEPSTYAMIGAGALGLLALRRRRTVCRPPDGQAR
jgi:hypothetical protein